MYILTCSSCISDNETFPKRSEAWKVNNELLFFITILSWELFELLLWLVIVCNFDIDASLVLKVSISVDLWLDLSCFSNKFSLKLSLTINWLLCFYPIILAIFFVCISTTKFIKSPLLGLFSGMLFKQFCIISWMNVLYFGFSGKKKSSLNLDFLSLNG